MRFVKSMAFTLALLFVSVLVAQSAAAGAPAEVNDSKVEAGLYDAIAAAGSGSYLVYMNDQADLSAAYDIEDWDARGEYVVDTLQSVAKESQADLMRFLKAQQRNGAVSGIDAHFVGNLIIVESDANILATVSNRADVSFIEADRVITVPEPKLDDAAVEALEYGITTINADDVWNAYGNGTGIVVGSVDTGGDFDHPAITNQYRGNNGGSFDHDHASYDPAGICGATPCDNNNHGTHTIGTMVGDDGGSNQIGVAPGAEWISAKGCESNFCSNASLLSSAEWMLAPCDWNQDPGHSSCSASMRPDVVNNSWGGGGGQTWYDASVAAYQASGIIPVFSAGNSGPFSGTIGSPADNCDVIAVGATDISDNVAGFSSRGPGAFAACTDKPDVSAPGVNVRSSINGGGYSNFNGTSMAAPHVAGCIALLKDIDSGLTYQEAYDALADNAVDLGAAGFDNNFGYGRIDCKAAADELDGGGGGGPFWPASWNLEFCWDGFSCGNVVMVAQQSGTFDAGGSTGEWLYNGIPKTSALMFDGGCLPIYVGKVVSGLDSTGEMYCQDGSGLFGTWSTTFLPSNAPLPAESSPLGIDVAGGNGVMAIEPASNTLNLPTFPFILEFCWNQAPPFSGCGTFSNMFLEYPDGTFTTDDGGSGIWNKNFTADTFAALFDGGCEPGYIGIGTGGFNSVGTMHCLVTGNDQAGTWASTYNPGNPVTATEGASSSSPR